MRPDWRTWGLLTGLALALAFLFAWALLNDRKLWGLFMGVPYFKPGSDEFKTLIRSASDISGTPAEWADSDALSQLVTAESGGWIGIPNYLYNKLYGKGFSSGANAAQWPAYWAQWRQGNFPPVDHTLGFTSRANGLAQMQPAGIIKYYPSGYAGIGVPVEEAVGLLRYIADRYGDPEAAWTHHTVHGTY